MHIVPRKALFTPSGARCGPVAANLKSVRRTLCFGDQSRQTRLEHDWRAGGQRPLTEEWTRLTECEEKSDQPIADFPQARSGVMLPGNKAK